jgi:hypothetical protein
MHPVEGIDVLFRQGRADLRAPNKPILVVMATMAYTEPFRTSAIGKKPTFDAAGWLTASGWLLKFKFGYLKTAGTETGHCSVVPARLKVEGRLEQHHEPLLLRRFKEAGVQAGRDTCLSK